MLLYGVIKNDSALLNGGIGSRNVMMWKFVGEDFKNNSQLVVSESDVALFMRDGRVVQEFTGGRYTLTTGNYPFWGALRRWLAGGAECYTASVYFVNLEHKLELKWGTDTPIQMRDPVYKLMTSVAARGAYTMRTVNPKKFLLKVVGTNIQMFTDTEASELFRSAFSQHIKDGIAAAIKESGQEILEVCTEKTRIAEHLAGVLRPLLEDYGLELVNFYLASIDIPPNDPNRQQLEEAFAQKGQLSILGDDWGRIQANNILRDLANNPGAGGVAAAGAGMGMGFAAAPVFGAMAEQMFAPMRKPEPPAPSAAPPGWDRGGSRFAPAPEAAAGPACPSCGTPQAANAQFCGECGQALARSCSACGASMAPGARFCSQCGNQNG